MAQHEPAPAQSPLPPARFLVRSGVFLAALAALAVWLHGPLIEGFRTNPPLNGTILAALAFGIAYTLTVMARTFLAALALRRAERLLANMGAGARAKGEAVETLGRHLPSELAEFLDTVRRVVREGTGAGTLPYLLDSLATRTEDRRALVRFLTGALILLGLIGTFYGLFLTIGGVREVLGGLQADPDADTVALLTGLRERLAEPLGGMGLAFSSSLFGLSASLVLAFLELQLFHAQSDLHTRVESLVVTRWVPLWQGSAPAREGPVAGPPVPEYIGALLEASAEQLEAVTRELGQAAARQQDLAAVGAAVDRLGEQVRTLGERLEQLEVDRTAALRSELRLLTRTLARSGGGETEA
jgi:hypothetical protein